VSPGKDEDLANAQLDDLVVKLKSAPEAELIRCHRSFGCVSTQMLHGHELMIR
jgi:hypothetical protein